MRLKKLYRQILFTLLSLTSPILSASPCSDNLVNPSKPVLREVYTIAASHSPRVVQSHGNCYIESVLGAVQDFILTELRQNNIFFTKELIVSRVGPNARLLSFLVESFIHGRRGPRTVENALKLIDGGSFLKSMALLKDIDLPLFNFSYRDPYSQTKEVIDATQVMLALLIQNKVGVPSAKEAIRTYLEKEVNHDFSHRLNAEQYFHIDSIELDPGFDEGKTEPTLREVVNANVPTLALYNADKEYTTTQNHLARVGGYLVDEKDEVAGLIIIDTGGLHGDASQSTTSLKMSLAEFKARGGELFPLKISGALIPRSLARPIPIIYRLTDLE